MIKKIRLFINNKKETIENAKLIKEKFIKYGYQVVDDYNYDLAVAVGGDGSFLRMLKANNFNSNIYYVGVNSGTLGFAQEIKLEDIDSFLLELRERKYLVSDVGIQEVVVNASSEEDSFYSINEIIVCDINLKMMRLDVFVENRLLENFCGDGLLICPPFGSTAHNLSYGGAIVYDSLSSLQITPLGPITSKVYRSLVNPIIIPDKKIIKMSPTYVEEEERISKNLLLTVDGCDKKYYNVSDISTTLNDKKIKCLRFSHYSYPDKIKDKLL